MAGDDLLRTPSMDGEVHPVAVSGFNADQSIYESARPSYPPAVLELVEREIVPSLGSPATAYTLSVLDLAAGTGKWTRLLLPFGIGKLVAVEPSPGMRREFQQMHPGVVVLDGSATAIPLPDASVDVIFIAQVPDLIGSPIPNLEKFGCEGGVWGNCLRIRSNLFVSDPACGSVHCS